MYVLHVRLLENVGDAPHNAADDDGDVAADCGTAAAPADGGGGGAILVHVVVAGGGSSWQWLCISQTSIPRRYTFPTFRSPMYHSSVIHVPQLRCMPLCVYLFFARQRVQANADGTRASSAG